MKNNEFLGKYRINNRKPDSVCQIIVFFHYRSIRHNCIMRTGDKVMIFRHEAVSLLFRNLLTRSRCSDAYFANNCFQWLAQISTVSVPRVFFTPTRVSRKLYKTIVNILLEQCDDIIATDSPFRKLLA